MSLNTITFKLYIIFSPCMMEDDSYYHKNEVTKHIHVL